MTGEAAILAATRRKRTVKKPKVPKKKKVPKRKAAVKKSKKGSPKKKKGAHTPPPSVRVRVHVPSHPFRCSIVMVPWLQGSHPENAADSSQTA